LADDGAAFDADAALRAAREACLANMLKASIGAPRMLGRRLRTRALHQIVHQNTPPPKAKIPFDAANDATTSGALEMRRRTREPRVTSSGRYHASIRARIYPRGTYPPVLRRRVLCELDVLEGWGLPKQISKASFGSKSMRQMKCSLLIGRDFSLPICPVPIHAPCCSAKKPGKTSL
jgi:hypothetical protein